MSKKIAIVLSGCGFKDGSEIHESVLAILSVVKAGATPVFFAPDKNQTKVTNHITDDVAEEQRNILNEAARIARGDIKDVKELKASDADAVIFPGGYGAAVNLCDFALKGPDCSVDPEVERVIKDFHHAKKPIGAICIAPALISKVLGPNAVEVTIGTDKQTASAIEKTGSKHINKQVDEIHLDEKNKVVSTPAYMLAQNIAEAEKGISKLVNKVVDMA